MERMKLGATGEFPQGKLTADDEGALNVTISSDGKIVKIDFGTTVAWVAFTPETAIDFARTLIRHAGGKE